MRQEGRNNRPAQVLPHDTDAEMSTLGAMMLDQNAIERVAAILRPDDFYHPAHQILCETIYSIHERNGAVDILTVRAELERANRLEAVGGMAGLTEILESVPTAANAEYYARIVEEKSTLRKLIRAAYEIIRIADEPDLDTTEKIDQAERCIYEVSDRRLGRQFIPINELVLETIEHFEQVQTSGRGIIGTPTHFTPLDRITSGLQPSELIILAARPSVGKTSFALNIAENIALKENRPVAIFSLEMSGQQLVQRMLCSQASVSAERVRHGRLTPDDWDRLQHASERLFRAPIYIDDTSSLSTLEMRAKCRRLKTQLGDLALVVLDYLQLMRSSNRRVENRNQEIGEIARSLKQIAREFEVPVIALSQLSRSIERRENKRPMLSDLRDSGSIEAEADVVMFIHREEYLSERDGSQRQSENRGPQEAEIIIAKQRNGPTGSVKLAFQPEFSRFLTIDPSYSSAY